MLEEPEAVLTAWFDLPHKDERDDEAVKSNLGPYYRQARRGTFRDWTRTEKGRLALIILFDQVPRHLFRDQPEQYTTDERAQQLASHFFQEGFPDAFTPEETFFAALPYLHAEDLEKQKTVNPLMHQCASSIEKLSFMADVADNYLKTIKRFGRFPHRNEILGRESTDEEEAWLKDS
ncbi:MAG: DUF924 family protein [bacterium]